MKLGQAVSALAAASSADASRVAHLIALAKIECERRGLRKFARFAGIDPANFAKVLTGARKLSRNLITRLEMVFTSRSAA